MGKAFRYPPDGALMEYYRAGDFLDSQSVPLPHPAPDAAELTIAIFFNMPGWVHLLLGLRNLLMAPFGLKTGSQADIAPPTAEQINSCSYSGIFAVHSATPTEVIPGTNDKHLDFRVSIRKDEAADCVSLSTGCVRTIASAAPIWRWSIPFTASSSPAALPMPANSG
ncbi:DUF2867 domain-containing protein [Devosia sp. A8/3-2]|nr:DUF2867 domain-containing protein [Devosia sp. A8/3-2]